MFDRNYAEHFLYGELRLIFYFLFVEKIFEESNDKLKITVLYKAENTGFIFSYINCKFFNSSLTNLIPISYFKLGTMESFSLIINKWEMKISQVWQIRDWRNIFCSKINFVQKKVQKYYLLISLSILCSGRHFLIILFIFLKTFFIRIKQ